MIALGKWLLGVIVEKLLNFFRNLVDDQKAREAERDAGRSEAVIEGRKQEDESLAGTRAAIEAADKKPIEYRD